MVRVGLIGCGTIGGRLARTIEQRYHRTARLVALHDTNRLHAKTLQRQLRSHPPIVPLHRVIQRSTLVIEAASAAVVPAVVACALRAHRDVLVMSVGGLLHGAAAWRRLSRRSRGRLYIPSGALAGLDGIKALATGRIRRVTLTTRKPPRAFAGAPYVLRRRLRLERLRRPTVIFDGTALGVVRAFPQNTNVAAALTLASGVAPHRTRVRVVADPTIRVNLHEVDVEGSCGRIRCRVQSRPSRNPKTSELAIRSALVTLQRFFDPVVIGS